MVRDLKSAIERGQLLGYMQGFPGSGKTTTSKKMADVTGLKVFFCGSTGTAAAQFKSMTVNSLLCLGLSVDRVDLSNETTSAQIITKIVQWMENYDLLLSIQQCLDPDLPFGGNHVLLLCGYMWQFPQIAT